MSDSASDSTTPFVHNARMHRRFVAFTWVLVALLLLAPLPVAAQETPTPAPAQETVSAQATGSETLQACSDVDESTLLDELNRVTQSVFAGALAQIDVPAIGDDQWGEMGLDTLVRGEVDRAVARIQDETDWWNLAQSTWSGDKARELTEKVAVATFDSETFRQALDDLSAAVANEVAVQIGAFSAESVSAAL
ncbi:MAG: hypothetical protein ACRC1H_09490, partial [Caldilineaceae bacterium]